MAARLMKSFQPPFACWNSVRIFDINIGCSERRVAARVPARDSSDKPEEIVNRAKIIGETGLPVTAKIR